MPKLVVICHVITFFFAALMHFAKTASNSYLNRIKNTYKNQHKVEEVYFIFK